MVTSRAVEKPKSSRESREPHVTNGLSRSNDLGPCTESKVISSPRLLSVTPPPSPAPTLPLRHHSLRLPTSRACRIQRMSRLRRPSSDKVPLVVGEFGNGQIRLDASTHVAQRGVGDRAGTLALEIGGAHPLHRGVGARPLQQQLAKVRRVENATPSRAAASAATASNDFGQSNVSSPSMRSWYRCSSCLGTSGLPAPSRQPEPSSLYAP